VNKYGKNVIELCKCAGIQMLNGRIPNDEIGNLTRIGTTGNSLIDYALSDIKMSIYIHQFNVIEQMPESDHCPIVVILNQKECVSNDAKCGEPAYRYLCRPDNVTLLPLQLESCECKQLISDFYESVIESKSVEEVSNVWSKAIELAMNNTFPLVKCKPPQQVKIDWLDDECKIHRDQIISCVNLEEKCELQKQYKCLKQRKKRLYRKTVLDTVDAACGSNTKLFWNTINKLPYNIKQKQKSCKMEVSDICEQLREISKIPEQDYFNKDFERECELFLKRYDEGVDNQIIKNTSELEILNDNITQAEIRNAINSLKNGKSPGLDMIPAECVKICAETIVPHLQMLYNYILSMETYPEKWAQGLRIAIPKGVDDIRPITIEPIFGKIFEIIVEKRLWFINNAFNRCDQYNVGFVKGSMTQDNMLILLSCIQKQMCCGKTLYVAFVDFKKAFNFVNRTLLFYKLIKSGLTGRTMNVLRDMYSKIKAKVKIGHLFYEWIYDKSGTNQGGPLSPSMFRKLLCDLRTYLVLSNGVILNDTEIMVHLLWADDMVLLSSTPQGLQKQLDGLFQFCSDYQMIVNTVKSKVMIFGKHDNVNFKFNNKNLDIVQTYKYLGVVFNSVQKQGSNLFKTMVEITSEKALKACFVATKKCSALGRVTPKISLQLFDSFVSPVLEYGCEVWSTGKQVVAIERIQLRYLKMLLGVKNSTTTMAVYAELGRMPVYIRFKIRIIKYWLRLCQLPDSMLVKKAYLMLKELDNLGFNTWVTIVRQILAECNVGHYINNDCITKEDEVIYVKEVKEFLYSTFQKECMESLNSFPILRTYVNFKLDFRLENYLLLIKDYNVRKCVTRLRLSSHDLRIEGGRHTKPKTPVAQRICQMCNFNQIECEKHFILLCPSYQEYRIKLFVNIMRIDSRLLEGEVQIVFKNIMCSKNELVIFKLGKYIQKCFKARKLANGVAV
jgi:hypothetical protein